MAEDGGAWKVAFYISWPGKACLVSCPLSRRWKEGVDVVDKAVLGQRERQVPDTEKQGGQCG